MIIFSLGVGGIVFAIRHGAANTINGMSFVAVLQRGEDSSCR